MRWGELAGLKATYLNLRRGRVTVTEVLAEVRGNVALKRPKTRTSARTIALPAALVDELRAHVATWPPSGAEQLVFHAPEGGPLRRTNLRSRVWLPAIKGSVAGRLRFHDLRHPHAALLIADGEDPDVVSRRLGHATIRTTYDIYGHLIEGKDDAAADRLSALMADRGSTADRIRESERTSSRAQETR